MDYEEMRLVNHDDLTGLNYIDPIEYLDAINHKYTLLNEVPRLISNMALLSYLSELEYNLINLGNWIFFLIDVDNKYITEEELTEIKFTINYILKDRYISNCYNDSKNKRSIWSYLDITLEDLYNNIFDESENHGLSIEDILGKTDFLQKLLDSKKGEKHNGNI